MIHRTGGIHTIEEAKKPEASTTVATLGKKPKIDEIATHIFNKEEIKHFRIDEAIKSHPLAHKPTNVRSRYAYAEILKNLKPTSKYLLPGQIVCFEYLEPKFKEELEYYDRTPLVLFCGITRTDNGDIREIGFNLHYYPPFARMRILNSVYEVFKHYFWKYFNEPAKKPNMFISYKALMAMCKRYSKIGFGIKMYIPTLRSKSYVVPTRLLSTAYYTEGHFSKATLAQIRAYWRSYK